MSSGRGSRRGAREGQQCETARGEQRNWREALHPACSSGEDQVFMWSSTTCVAYVSPSAFLWVHRGGFTGEGGRGKGPPWRQGTANWATLPRLHVPTLFPSRSSQQHHRYRDSDAYSRKLYGGTAGGRQTGAADGTEHKVAGR